LKAVAAAIQQRRDRIRWIAALAVLVGFSWFFWGTCFTADDYYWLFFCDHAPPVVNLFLEDTLCREFFRPVGELWWMAADALGGGSRLGFQIAFLSLHLVDGFLAATLASRILLNREVFPVSFVAFTLNPLLVSQVTTHYFFAFDAVGLLFYLAGLLLLVEGRRRSSSLLSLCSVPCALLAYFSKEAFLTFPVAAFGVLFAVNEDDARRRRNVGEAWGWTIVHFIFLGAAVFWRFVVIRKLGGYGLASIHGAGDLFGHVVERAFRWGSFALTGWLPGAELLGPGFSVAAAVAGVALIARMWLRRNDRRLVYWCLLWMLLTWTPSLLMVTYAPVSWYTPCVGWSALLAAYFARAPLGRWLSAGYFVLVACSALAFYSKRSEYVAEIGRQEAALERRFLSGGYEIEGDRPCVLWGIMPELYPDPFIKRAVPPLAPAPRVVFVNPEAPTVWGVRNALDEPPPPGLKFNERFGGTFVSLGRFRVYPFELNDREGALASTSFVHWKWNGEMFEPIK